MHESTTLRASDGVDLEGVTFRHDDGPGFEGELTIENAAMQRDCVFDVRMKEGVLKLMTIEWGVPTTITAEPDNGRTRDVVVQVRLDKCCWIAGSGATLRKLGAIGEHVQDAEDVPDRKVKARVTSSAKRSHKLVNYEELRLRVPAVR